MSRYAQSPVNVRRPPLPKNALQSVPPAGSIFAGKPQKVVFLRSPHPGSKFGFFPNFRKKWVSTAFQTTQEPLFLGFFQKLLIFGEIWGGSILAKIAVFSDPVRVEPRLSL